MNKVQGITICKNRIPDLSLKKMISQLGQRHHCKFIIHSRKKKDTKMETRDLRDFLRIHGCCTKREHVNSRDKRHRTRV
ncbi:Uncharacterized protein TCM_020018 [Theobroma cacao]|uniref:Uncharacterized protein n=1 Tax=Theobroma cacao TaxID=3641 RepID=A0A061EIJ8_THECC|nr:Uncharacterized protein TCM_020018 [Theobroma cacao]